MKGQGGDSWLRCIGCGRKLSRERTFYRCPSCGDLLEAVHDFQEGPWTEGHIRGVWKYKALIYPGIPEGSLITMGEGDTYHHRSERLSRFSGVGSLFLKHEGENPTGSFKDRGMTVAVSEAARLGVRSTICASTGNTSASSAAYSSMAGIESNVLVPEGKVSRSKIAQAMGYGANIVKISGDFDAAMRIVQELVERNPGFYLLNSVNPWRLEGQKSIAFEIMDHVRDVDFISVPAGNLGNTTAIGKGLREMKELGIIDRVPRILSVQAEGANPFYRLWKGETSDLVPVIADTVATAIRIGNPINWRKALKSLEYTHGMVTAVSDDEILEAKREIDRSGIGCEPASAASLAGVRKLADDGTIDRSDTVFCVLTGNMLKDINSIVATGKEMSFEEMVQAAGMQASAPQ